MDEAKKLLREIVDNSTALFFKNFDVNEDFPSHNGIYFDKESHVRILSHVLTLERTSNYLDDCQYRQIAEKLYTSKFYTGTYYEQRFSKDRDVTNGVIGAAWVIEGFVAAYDRLLDERYLNRAIDVAMDHVFDPDVGLWLARGIEYSKYVLDKTFNHQLWFAYSLSELLKRKPNDYLYSTLQEFIEKIDSNIAFRFNGVIRQQIKYRGLKENIKFLVKNIWKRTWYRDTLEKEHGYHLFNSIPLLFLVQDFKNELSHLAEKYLLYFREEGNTLLMLDSKYSFPYNVPTNEIMAVIKLNEQFNVLTRKSITDICDMIIYHHKSLDMSTIVDQNLWHVRTYEYLLCDY